MRSQEINELGDEIEDLRERLDDILTDIEDLLDGLRSHTVPERRDGGSDGE